MHAADEAIARHALARGFVSSAQLEQARRRQALLLQTGVPTDLLGVLEAALAPAQLAELRALAGGADLAAPAGATLAPAAPPPAAAPVARAPALLPAGAVRPGDRVGPYVVQDELGRGGMGAVFRAEHVDLRRPVALKVQLGNDARATKRFVAEARAAARLRHPHIVAVHDVGADERGRPWMAMDLVQGESLDVRVRRDGPLPPHDVARIGATIARALEHAHAEGVLHRDLKPANIIRRASDGAPLVTDFGLAKVVAGAESLTRTGEVLGTPAFMPPEQAAGKDVDARADVWSLGATLYALLVGAPPFEGGGLVGTLAAVLRGEVEPPRARRPDVPPALEAVILRCLTKDLEARYPSASAVALDLEALLRGETPVALARKRARRARALALAGVAALALAALAVAAVALARAVDAPAAATPPTAPTPDEPTPAAPETPAPSTVTEVAPPTQEPTPPPPPTAPDPDAIEAFTRRSMWRRVAADASLCPPARWGHAMTWDPRRERVVLFGGKPSGERAFDDLWTWDGARWHDETTRPAPAPRAACAMAYDGARGVLVVHGGGVSSAPSFDDLWEHDGRAWRLIPTRGGPGQRRHHAAVYDPAGRRVLLFGGVGPEGDVADLWAWDGERWTLIDAPGGPGGGRLSAAAWDPRRDVLVVVAGVEGEPLSRHWEWHPARGWSRVESALTGPRSGPALVSYPLGVILFAGTGEHGGLRNDTWAFDGQTWTHALEGVGEVLLPPRRRYHATAWDAARRELVVFGGEARGARADTWVYSALD